MKYQYLEHSDMKKIMIITLVLLAASMITNGQLNSGATYLSAATRGNVGFTHKPNDFDYQENSIQLGFYPEVGYFIVNRWALGASAQIDINRVLGETGYSEKNMVFGPNVRYYLPGDEGMQIFFYGFGGYGFVPGHQLFKFMLGPGINLFFTGKIAFEARILYSFAREWNIEGGGHHHIHDLGFTAGISLFFSGSEN